MATNDEVFSRFMEEIGRENPDFLKGRSPGLHVDLDLRELRYSRNNTDHSGWGTPGNGQWHCDSLARYVGKRNRGVLLVNGVGWEDQYSTNWQNRLRRDGMARFGQPKVMTIPYPALTAGGIIFDSIHPIEVTEDTNQSFQRELPDVYSEFTLQKCLDMVEHKQAMITEDTGGRMQFEFSWKGERWRLSFNSRPVPKVPSSFESSVPFHERKPATHSNSVWKTPQHGVPNWQPLSFSKRPDGSFATTWVERIHRLGASIFYANTDLDGRRHRYISAFDTEERTPMYYLAQLPDKGKITNYDDAIAALAPPIVHKAREQGRNVVRQGDVFAIETTLSDKQVYADAKTRVRREVVLQVPRVLDGMIEPWLPLHEGELWEYAACPFGGGHKHRVGNGPKARRALMIYGTGHTATEVVVKKSGATYIKGTMFHDPQLEEAGRRPEHQNKTLPGEKGDGWFLAVRNTVPRQKRRTPQAVEANDVVATTPDLRVVEAAA